MKSLSICSRRSTGWLLLLFLLWSELVIAQTTTDFRKVVPASPNVAALTKYTDIPVNNYTGTPSIDIPLYTIKTRDLVVPLSLSYHGSGIRVEEEASTVGLGWVLNAGGVINHVIRGRDDFNDFDGATWRNLSSSAVNGGSGVCYFFENPNSAYFLTSNTINGNALQEKLLSVYQMAGNQNADGERDIFSFNFLGQSGKFVIEPLGGAQYKIHLLSQSDLRIQLINATLPNNGFIITGVDGTKYHFAQAEAQRYRSGKKSNVGKQYKGVDTDPLYGNEETGFEPSAYTTYTGAWYLTKIESQRGDVIIFTYTVSTGYVKALISRMETYMTGNASYVGRWSITGTETQQVYPNTISFDNGTVQFSLASREDLRTGGMRVTGLNVTATGGASLKTVQFTQSYFNSGQNSPSFVAKRLKLQSVQESNGGVCTPPYTFSYEESIALPNKDSYAQDYWGYYNGNNINNTRGPDGNGTLLPPIDIQSGLYKLPGVFQGGADRSPNATYMRAGVLTQITYPTGGTTEFDFQPHTFSNWQINNPRPYLYVQEYTGSTPRIGGGLRIDKITAKDQGNVKQVTNFDYRQPGSDPSMPSSTGKLMYHLIFGEFVPVLVDPANPTNGTTYQMLFTSQPRHPMGSGAQGNPIGYNTVTVYKGATKGDAGYTSYTYENQVDKRDVNFCLSTPSGSLENQVNCTTGISNVTYDIYCDPYGSGASLNYTSVTEASLPNYVYTLNGSLLREDHFKGATPGVLVKTIVNEYETTNRSRIKNFKVLKRGAIYSSIIYYTDSEWIRLKKTIVNEYDEGGNTSQVASTTTTYGFNATGQHKQVTSVIKDNSKGEQFETVTTYPQDDVSGAAVMTDLKNRNMVVPIQETRNKINAGQSRTVTHSTKTNYSIWFNTFMAPQTIESKLGSGPFVIDASFDYSSSGNLASITGRDGIRSDYQYFTASGKNNLLQTHILGAGTSSARSTTYDYEPLKGVSKITDPNGISSTYTYDLLGRLSAIKDNNQNLVKTYHYNYSPDGCRVQGSLISAPTPIPSESIDSFAYQRVLIIGNSITKIPARLDGSGWDSPALRAELGGWGMAASAKEKDYVNILTSRFKALNPSAQVVPTYLPQFEHNPGWNGFNYDTLQTIVSQFFGGQKPDLVIVRVVENVDNAKVNNPANSFKTGYNALLNKLVSVAETNAKIVLTTSFWEKQPDADAVIRQVATERALPLVELGNMRYNPLFRAANDPVTIAAFPNADFGVNEHPGDTGMLEIADRIWGKLTGQTHTPVPSPTNCATPSAVLLTPANSSSVVGSWAARPDGNLGLTIPFSLSVCIPSGQIIKQVEVWASTTSDGFQRKVGNAIATVSNPNTFTLASLVGSSNGMWLPADGSTQAGPLDPGAFKFWVKATTYTNTTFESSKSTITLVAPSGGAGCSLTKVRVFPRTDCCSGRTVGAQIQVSTVGKDGPWTTVFTIPSGETTTWREFDISGATGTYKAIRYLSPTAANTNVAELEFYSGSTKLTGTPFGDPGGPHQGNAAVSFEKAFDGNTSTYYDALNPTGGYVGLELTNCAPSGSWAASMISPVTNSNVVGIWTTRPDNSQGLTFPFSVSVTVPSGQSVGSVQIRARTTDGSVDRLVGHAVLSSGTTYTLGSGMGASGSSGKWLPPSSTEAGPLDPGTFIFYVVVKRPDNTTAISTQTSSPVTVTLTAPASGGSGTVSFVSPVNNSSVVGTAVSGYTGYTLPFSVNVTTSGGATVGTVEIWASTYNNSVTRKVGHAVLSSGTTYTVGTSVGTGNGQWLPPSSTEAGPLNADTNPYKFWAVVKRPDNTTLVSNSTTPVSVTLTTPSGSGSWGATMVNPANNSTLTGVLTTRPDNSQGLTIPFSVNVTVPSGQSVGSVQIRAQTLDGSIDRLVGNAVLSSGTTYTLGSGMGAAGSSGQWLPPSSTEAGPLDAGSFKFYTVVKRPDNTTAVSTLSTPTTVSLTAPTGSGNGCSLTKVRIYPRADCCASRVVGAQIQVTSDGTNWTTVLTVPGPVTTASWLEFPITGATNIKSIRYVALSNAWANVAELEFYSGTTKLTGTPFGSNQGNQTMNYTKAFDGNVNTYFEAATIANGYLGMELTGCPQ
ncbi:discoidin domain-containing protein [Larkinella sp. VNQ87]|uniref:discoidin domain-containing protein n=1 Tax=Larkinella sp. VNQ87 TaxID=3400921 RepID=UPI003BFEE3FA